MIRNVELKRFKCFEHLSLPLGRLTVLSGGNASGKSTVLQALAVLRQSVVDAEWSGGLVLDGSLLRLGCVADVVDRVHGRHLLSIGIWGDSCQATWEFGSERQERDSVTMPVQRVVWYEGEQRHDADTAASPQPFQSLLPTHAQGAGAQAVRSTLAKIDYVGAERIGPRETYRLAAPTWHDVMGVHGERAPGALWLFGHEDAAPAIAVPGVPPTVRGQTEAWLARFFPGVVIRVEKVPNANAVSLGFQTSPDVGFSRPQHVGYGVSHVLPLIVAGVRAGPGRTLLIENPEAHLHPSGQAAIGRFLAQVVGSGACVVVETHSDHVLNGVRRAVSERVLRPSDVAVHYFTERSLAAAKGVAQVESPSLAVDGRMSHWPEGFFDQFDRDMAALAGLGRP